jgi:hypothetical protein
MTLNHRAVKTTREAHHPCGHRARKTAASHDLSARRRSVRAGHARRLTAKDCTDYWRAGRDAAVPRERVTWLAGRRAEELTETEVWEKRAAAMPALDGSNKAVERGRQVRYQLLAATHDTLDAAKDYFAVRAENPARRIDSASWWSFPSSSSQRDTEPVDLEDLVTDAASNEPASSSGNPY